MMVQTMELAVAPLTIVQRIRSAIVAALGWAAGWGHHKCLNVYSSRIRKIPVPVFRGFLDCGVVWGVELCGEREGGAGESERREMQGEARVLAQRDLCPVL